MKHKFALGLLFLSMAVSVSAQSTKAALQLEPGVAAHKGIDDIYKKFSAAYKQLDIDAVADLYAENADYLPPGGKPLKGRAAIRENFAGFFNSVKQRGQTMNITFRIVQREVTDKMGYEIGIYTLTMFKDGSRIGQGQGRFVVVTKKAGKNWQLQLDTYNELPPEKK